jgi:capsular exopolysaccharide synthesis family protein
MIEDFDESGRRPVAARQLADYLRALRRRWPLLLATTVLATGTAVAVSLSSEEKYDAKAQLLLREPEGVGTVGSTAPRPTSSDREREVRTEAALIKLDSIAERVRRRLNLTISNADLLDEVTTETERSSDLVTIVVRDPSPLRAARVATAFANEYVEFRVASARRNLTEAAELARREYQGLGPEVQQSLEGRELLARERELRVAAALQTGGVQIVRRASVPTDPSRPRPKLSAALGAALGLLLGIAAAMVREFADRRLRDEEAIERAFGLPVLGVVPRAPKRAMAAAAEDPFQREAFGLLASNLSFSTPDEGSRVFVITSPSPEEGKTSVTFGLARALARLGLRVIALEADLRRPAFVRYTAGGETGGLTRLLSGVGSLSHELVWLDAATLAPITVDSLDDDLAFAVLRSGAIAPNPQRMLARPAMASVVESARLLADVVLIDTPPVGTVNDALTLSRLVDGILLVARQGRTTKDAARRARRALRNVDAKVLGVIVTDAPATAPAYGYYGELEAPAKRHRAVEEPRPGSTAQA